MKQPLLPLLSTLQSSFFSSRYDSGGIRQKSIIPILLLAGTISVILALAVLSPGLSQADSPPGSEAVVDSFETVQPPLSLIAQDDTPTTAFSAVSGLDILGGERDLEITLTGKNGTSLKAGVSSSSYFLASGPAIQGIARISWDGPDGDPVTLDPTGLGGIDLTNGGAQYAFLLEISFDDSPVDLTLEVFTNDGNSSILTKTLPGGIFGPTANFVLPFSDFMPTSGDGADFTNVGAVTLSITAATAPDLVIDSLSTISLLVATKTDLLLVDSNGDQQANPGDRLQYTVTITNPADSLGLDATGVVFSDTLDLNTTLIENSVTTTQGTVTSGNNTGDTDVGVDIGTIVDGTTATIVFKATISGPLPPEVTEVSNQGFVSTDTLINLPTDDPETDTRNDATTTPVFPAPVIKAAKVDLLLVDNDGDNQADPGDTLQYTVAISNSSSEAATGVVFNDTLDVNTTLVVGSVTTTQGTVTSGQMAGDTSVAVDIGTLAGAGSNATITFDATINDPLPAGVTEVANQGTVLGSNIADAPTDDPETDSADDPTVTLIVSP